MQGIQEYCRSGIAGNRLFLLQCAGGADPRIWGEKEREAALCDQQEDLCAFGFSLDQIPAKRPETQLIHTTDFFRIL
jgi:hypothetical protein